MADLKISQLPALGDNLATADKIAVVDGSASETKSLTIANLFSANSFGLLGSNAIPIAKVSVTAGSIAGTAVADLGISTAKVANDAITSAKLDNNSSAQIVTSLPGSGGFTGQIAANSNDGYAASIWDGSAWQSLKAAASINSITGDTTSIVNIAVATSGSTRALSASIDNSSAAAQFLAGPSGAAGAVSLRAITGADLPTATSSALGAIKVNGEGLRMDTGVIEIDNDVTASSAYNLVSVSAKGLVTAARVIQSSDLPAGTTSAKGALQVGTGLAVSSGVISVDNTATAGTYTKVTITASGLVSSGTTLTDADLPNHSAALLTSGTLATARLGTKSVTAAKLGDASTVVFQSIAQTGTYPSPAFQGQLLFDTTTEDCFVHDGTAWQPITTLSKGALINGGTYNASTSKVASVTSAGAAAGLVVGSNLPTASANTDALYVVVSVQGTPSGISGITGQLSPPDYILGVTNTSGSSWVEIDLSQTVASQVASNIAFTPYGGLSSTNLQDVLQEVETEKLSKTGGTVSGEILISNTGSLVYEGATADSFETTIGVVDPTTADKTINFPDQSGTVLVSGGASIANADVATNCALAYSKLAALASGSILVGNASSVATVQALSGDATLSNAGVLTIASSAITNAKISSSAAIALSKLATGSLPTAITISNSNVASNAAIAGSKISPDFGTQAITTTGNLTLNNQADLRLGDADGSNYTAIQAGSTIGTNYTIELPTTVGATGKVLKSTVSGQVATLTWEDDASNTAASSLTGNTLASGVTASSLISLGSLSGLVVDGDMTLTGQSSNIVFDKSDNALEFADDAKATFGDSDLQIYHDQSNSVIKEAGTGNLILQSTAGEIQLAKDSSYEPMVRAIVDGAVYLYHNNVKTFETVSDGIKVLGPEGSAAYYYLFADEGDDNADKWRLQADTSGNFKVANYSTGSWVNGLTLDGSNNATFAGGVGLSGELDFTGVADKYIDSYLYAGSGTKHWMTFRSVDSSNNHETALRYQFDGPVELFYDNVKRIQTESSGATVIGNLTVDHSTNNQILFNAGDGAIEICRSGAGAYIDFKNSTGEDYDARLSETSGGITCSGSLSDSKGDLRIIPRNNQTSQYTLVVGDVGKVVGVTSGGWIIPANVFTTVGQVVTLLNRSASDQTINASALTYFWNVADGVNIKANTLTLGARSMATIWFEGSDTGYIQASALTVS